MKELQFLMYMIIWLSTSSCFLSQEKHIGKKGCSGVYETLSNEFMNDSKGRLTSTLNMSDFFSEHKDCFVEMKKSEIISLLGSPLIGEVNEEEAYPQNVIYVTSQNCTPESKICQQINFVINNQNQTVSDLLLIVTQ